MSELSSLDLYKWVTEEMGYFPKKICGSSKIALDHNDFDFLMASKRDLWDHVMKHVHSVNKVLHVRKNILLSRLRENKLQGIQKADIVGNKIHLLGEVKHAQGRLEKSRKEAEECEKLLNNQRTFLKIAGCKRRHLQATVANAERRYILLKTSGDTIQTLTDAFNSSLKNISLEKAPSALIHRCNPINVQQHSTFGSEGDSAYESTCISVISPVSAESKRFLEKCVSMSKDLLDEKLQSLYIERFSSNSSVISEISQLCIDSRTMDFDTLRLHNAISDSRKKELKSYISNNVKNFSSQHLFESLLSLISEKHKKFTMSYDDNYSTLDQKICEEDSINDLECLLSEQLTHLHASITHDFAVAAQEKVAILRMKNELKKLMISIEKDLNKLFPDNAMQEKVYELIKVMIQEASIGGSIAFLKKSVNDMYGETSDSSQVYLMKKLDEQLKAMEDEMVCHGKALKYLQSIQDEIDKNCINNQDEVRRCLINVNPEIIMRTLGDVELLVELPRRELIIFNEYPLENHSKSIFLGKEVSDSRFLMNGHILGDVISRKEGNYSQWVKLTLGMAPYSSTEHILSVLFKVKGMVEMLSGSSMNVESEMLQNVVAKIPGLLKCLDDDDKQSETAVKETCNFVRMGRSQTEKEMEEANSIHNTWSEGKLNKCVPECNEFEGKSLLQWYYDIHSLLQKKGLL